MKKKTTVLFLIFIFNINLYGQFEQDRHKYKVYSINKPKDLNFANEPTPIKNYDIYERFDKEILINTYWQSRTILLIKRSIKYFPIIEEILNKNNIPNDFKFLALAESGLENVTSPSGAKGFWQFLKNTGIEYGLEISNEIDERLHIQKATQAACEYINKAYSELGSWTLAAAAYNMGIHGLKNQIEKQKSNNYYDLLLNEETSRYIFRIIALKEIVNNQNNYGFYINPNDNYLTIKYIQVLVDSSIMNIANFALNMGLNYKIIKQSNPWILKNKISNKNKKEYQLNIPKKEYVHINDKHEN